MCERILVPLLEQACITQSSDIHGLVGSARAGTFQQCCAAFGITAAARYESQQVLRVGQMRIFSQRFFTCVLRFGVLSTSIENVGVFKRCG